MEEIDDQRPVVISLLSLAHAIDAAAAEDEWPWSVDDEADGDARVEDEDGGGLPQLGPGMSLLRESGDLLEQAARAGIIESLGWAPHIVLDQIDSSSHAQQLAADGEPMGSSESVLGSLAMPDRVQLALRLWAGEAATGEAGAPRVLVLSSGWETSSASGTEEGLHDDSAAVARDEADALATAHKELDGSFEQIVALAAADAASVPAVCVGAVLAEHARATTERIEEAAKAAADVATAAIAAAAKGKGKKGKKSKKKKKGKKDEEGAAPQSIADAAAAAVDAEENEAARRGPFAPIAQRMRKQDCTKGFVLYGLPKTEAGQRELAASLLSSGISPTCCLVSHPSVAPDVEIGNPRSSRKQLPSLPDSPPLGALAPCSYVGL